MEILKEVGNAGTIGISGHVRPDGDCVGAVMGLCLYLRKKMPKAVVDVFLEKPAAIFDGISGIGDVRWDFQSEVETYDVFFALDTVKERMGEGEKFYDRAGKKINIDHHISNRGCGDVNHIDWKASSTCEMIYRGIGNPGDLDEEIAKALYMGMAHDTGVFCYSNTSPETLRIAAELIGYGFDFSKLIAETFYEKTYVQNQILGRAVLESIVFMDGKCIVSSLDVKTMNFYGVTSKDMEGIVNQLLVTKGVECAIFMYQVGVLEYKVSLRSKGAVDVARIASYFGGGGHKRASGVTMNGTFHDIVNNISLHIEKQLQNG